MVVSGLFARSFFGHFSDIITGGSDHDLCIALVLPHEGEKRSGGILSIEHLHRIFNDISPPVFRAACGDLETGELIWESTRRNHQPVIP